MDTPEAKHRGFATWLWRRPRHWFLLGIPAGGLLMLIVGVAVAGGFVGALKIASSDRFCTSCHEMNAPFQELTHTVHFSNELGIRAGCADCHVPPTFLPGLMRHMAAILEGWGHLRGELDTPAKYESHRMELAQKVWMEMKAKDSAECRSCHLTAEMAATSHLSPSATAAAISPATMHQWMAASYTCIDCHKGIAHTLPKAD